ncbi:MAG: serine hydrolase [Proteobacteria bacterium]|nr:serine hydrolase [Pseudomonadota bacterium]
MCLRKSRPLIAVFSVVLCVGIRFSGCETSQAQGSDIPVEGAIQYVHEPDNSFRTYIDIVIGKGFTGNLPDDIDTITVTGPSGDLPISKDDFAYIPQFKDFWIRIPGSPEIGTYMFTVTSGNRSGSSTDTQSVLRTIPLPDTSTFKPAKGETLTCKSPTFFWSGADEGIPLYYRIEIKDIKGNRVYSTNYVKDMHSIRLPPDLLKVGQTYRWRVRVVDGANRVTVNNRSHSHWLPFSVSQGQCEYAYQMPEKTDDGWETSSLSKEGIDPEKVNELISNILDGNFPHIHSVLLIKNGKLVLEEYFYGYDRDAKHQMHSVTKSITSILVGMAVDRKMIPSVDKKVYEFFPEYKGTSWIGQKYEIDLRDVLTMTAGLDWDETTYSLSDSRNSLVEMFQSNNWIEYVLDRKVIEPPGERFIYNGGLTLFLAEIVRKASGLYADKFAEQNLFSPLGISDYHWLKHPDGTINSFGGLSLRPRDMAKIGHLFLNEGEWKGRQIVSQKWINESSRERIATGGGYGYGYQWWRGKAVISNQVIEAFWAWGRGGQFIFVFPSLDLVAVFTSEPYANPEGESRPFVMLTKYIIPAQLAEVPLRKSIKLDPEVLDEYLGEYKFTHSDEIITIFRQGDKLYAKAPDGDIEELLPATEDQFFGTAKDMGDFLVNVLRDERGEVKHVIVHFPFRRLQLDKIE